MIGHYRARKINILPGFFLTFGHELIDTFSRILSDYSFFLWPSKIAENILQYSDYFRYGYYLLTPWFVKSSMRFQQNKKTTTNNFCLTYSNSTFRSQTCLSARNAQAHCVYHTISKWTRKRAEKYKTTRLLRSSMESQLEGQRHDDVAGASCKNQPTGTKTTIETFYNSNYNKITTKMKQQSKWTSESSKNINLAYNL